MDTSFILRPWQSADLDSLVHNANNWEVAKNLSDRFPYPYTEEAGKAFIEQVNQTQPPRHLAIVVSDKAVGGIGVYPQEGIHRRNAELGYWLGEAFWGKGIISKAIPQIIDYVFSNFELDRVFARVFDTNIASQKVLLKSGFELEARFEKTLIKDNKLFDELIFAIRHPTINEQR